MSSVTADSGESRTPALNDRIRREIDDWIKRYPTEWKSSGVLTALHLAQEHNGGWLTRDLMDAVADHLEMPRVSVYEVATFYSMLNTKQVGRHVISICTNISCMLCGSQGIVDYMEQKLGIKLGETTSDGRITLKIEEECLAACAGGPMMTVNGHYHERLTPEAVDKILDELE